MPGIAQYRFALATLVVLLAPIGLHAQATDSIALANAYVARAESLAKAGDTTSYSRALGLLDSAAARAWTAGVVFARLRISVPYAEQLITLASQTRGCATAHQAATVAAVAERSVPSGMPVDVPWILDFSRRAIQARDSAPRLVRALCTR